VKVALKFVPQDCWLGIYWRRTPIEFWDMGDPTHNCGWDWKVYLCLLPCLPIVFSWKRARCP